MRHWTCLGKSVAFHDQRTGMFGKLNRKALRDQYAKTA